MLLLARFRRVHFVIFCNHLRYFFIKISSFLAARFNRTRGVAASAVVTNAKTLASIALLGVVLQGAQAQAQPVVGRAADGTPLVAVDNQIVPAAAVIGHATHNDFSPLSLFPNARKWPGGLVAYTYDPNMNARKQAIFESACREWEGIANLKFTPRVAETGYMVVTSTVNESNSRIGMTGGAQVLNLADWANKITAMHELAHALGFIHEQSRPDRDTYVKISTENIQDGLEFNFAKIAGALNQTDYDFDSMMHYPAKAFSKNGMDTITVIAPYTSFQGKMGQSNHVSDGDKSGMIAVYGAPGPNGKGILSPAFPKTNDTLTATLPDESPTEEYVYAWSKNGVRIEGETSKTLDLSKPGNGDKGDEISVLIGRKVVTPGGTRLENIDTAAVTIGNSAPSVTPEDPEQPLTAVNSKPLEGQITGTDADNDDLTFIVVTPPENGALDLKADGSFTYTANADFVGTDGFKVAANDGSTSGLPETFSIEVGEANLPPDFASITAYDGWGGEKTAEITIEVKVDNRAPIVRARIAPTSPKTKDTLTVTAEITDQTQTTVTTIYNFKVNGKSVQSGNSNTLDLGVAGNGDKGDVITCEVTATNEGGGKGTATVEATVLNSAPVALSGSGMANADELTAFNIGGLDADGEALTINIVGGPANGAASVGKDKEGNFKLFYRSKPAFGGTDTVHFTVSDSEATSSNTSTFAIGVKYVAPLVNRAPVAGDTTINTYVGASVTKNLLGRDPDGDPITFRIVNNARYGKSEIKRDKDGLWKLCYTSLNRLYGSDRVTYIAIDNKGKQSNIATIAINFINRSPIASANRITVASGEPVSQYLFAKDLDNDPITFRLVNNPRYGKGEIKRDAQGAWRVYYRSLETYVGADRINFIAIDAAGKESAPATIEINVVRPATKPSASGALQSGVAPSAGKS